ncbi:Hypothetical predicted protein, partial [Paramuricea clavata]
MPIFKLREILRYHNVLDCDTKDELAIRVGMVISGTASLAFKREVFAIKNLVTATRSLIQRQKRMYILDPKIISKQRMFTTPSSPTISTSRPRDSASVFSKKTKAFIPLPPDLSWYRAKVLEYDRATDVVKLEFDVEEDVNYNYVVKDEVKASRLKLAKDTQRMVDDYENIFQIRAVVEVSWSKDDVVETDLLPGWHEAEVQSFDRDEDENDI